jgi:hypothetical protein
VGEKLCAWEVSTKLGIIIKMVEELWGRKESVRVDGCLERGRLVP